MSSHISQSEFNRYFSIITSKAPIGDDIDFVNEIDAHVGECSECFEKMQAVRLLMRELVSDKEAATGFIQKWYPETTAQPVFDIRKVFPGVKVIITEKLQALADTLSNKMNVVFVQNQMSPAMARGASDMSETSETAEIKSVNDLLHSNMEMEFQNGRKVVLRCRKCEDKCEGDNHEDITLFIYSNFEVDFMLVSRETETEIPLFKKEYDDLIGEYVYSYKIGHGEAGYNLIPR